jgi:hypothetical protein
MRKQYEDKGGDVFFRFGTSRDLFTYLSMTDFFLLSDKFRLFRTDLPSLSVDDKSYQIRRDRFTEKILMTKWKLLSYDDYEKDCYTLPFKLENEIYTSVSKNIARVIENNNLQAHGISDKDKTEVCKAYYHIIHNSTKHNIYSEDEVLVGSSTNSYYTFQSYRNSGVTFANSDHGKGFYQTIFRKVEKEGYSTRIFKSEDYMKLDDDMKDLAGILEGISYRMPKKGVKGEPVYGLPNIIHSLVYLHNAVLKIHSGSAILRIDREMQNEYFPINSKLTKIGKQYDSMTIEKKIFRKWFTDTNFFKSVINKHIVKKLDYSFSGVHIEVFLDLRRKNEDITV